MTEDRKALLRAQSKQNAIERFDLGGAQAGRRLIEKEKLRAGRQRPGNFKPPLLSERQCRRSDRCIVADADKSSKDLAPPAAPMFPTDYIGGCDSSR